jgi:hypothetical protein
MDFLQAVKDLVNGDIEPWKRMTSAELRQIGLKMVDTV